MPSGAWDGEGNDCARCSRTPRSKVRRGIHADAVMTDCNLACVHARLGDVKPNAPLRLWMTGICELLQATSLYASWQAGISPSPTFVEAHNAGEKKRHVEDDPREAGAGRPERTMWSDLPASCPAGTRRSDSKSNLNSTGTRC